MFPIREDRATRRVVLATYLALTVVFTLAFVFERGVFAETGWFVNAQNMAGWTWLFWPDPSRPLAQTPITLGYFLTGGSYLGIFLLYALSILLTGLLTQKILLFLAPDKPVLAFLAGAFTLIHGADQAVNQFGMIVVRQGVVGILSASLAVLWYLKKGTRSLLVWVILGEAVALWSYDAALGLILGVSVLFAVFGRLREHRWRVVLAAWVLAPSLYVAQLVYRYLIVGERSYQSKKVVIPAWSAVTERAQAFVEAGLGFWNWSDHWLAITRNCVANANAIVQPWLMAGIAMFAVGLVWSMVLQKKTREAVPAAGAGLLVLTLGATILLAATYLPWFFVVDAGGSWRTQFYGAPGAGTLLALALAVVGQITIRRLPLGWIAAAPVALAVVGFGLYAGLVSQLDQSYRWHVYRTVMNGIVEAAPQLKPHTLIVQTNIPDVYPATICIADPFPDPFQDDWWFEVGTRVLYPKTYLTATYYLAEGGPRSKPDRLKWSARAVDLFDSNGKQVDTFTYAEVLVFRFDPATGSRLLSTIPEALLGGVVPEGYDARSAIASAQMPEETRKKLRVTAVRLP